MERLLTKAQVRSITTYSFAHTARLEAEGKHPKRVKIGSGRVAYVESEIIEWVQARIAERDATHAP